MKQGEGLAQVLPLPAARGLTSGHVAKTGRKPAPLSLAAARSSAAWAGA